jgi:hypothetical protein
MSVIISWTSSSFSMPSPSLSYCSNFRRSNAPYPPSVKTNAGGVGGSGVDRASPEASAASTRAAGCAAGEASAVCFPSSFAAARSAAARSAARSCVERVLGDAWLRPRGPEVAFSRCRRLTSSWTSRSSDERACTLRASATLGCSPSCDTVLMTLVGVVDLLDDMTLGGPRMP